MSVFPGAGAQVYYNEAGEPLGWDYPSDGDYEEAEAGFDARDNIEEPFQCKCGEKFNVDDRWDIIYHHEVCSEPDWLVSQFPDELKEEASPWPHE